MKLPISTAKGLIGGLISETFKDIYNVYLEELKEFVEDYVITYSACVDDKCFLEINEDSLESSEIINNFKNRLIDRVKEIKINFDCTDMHNIVHTNEETEV